MKKRTFHICEYGLIRSKEDFDPLERSTLEVLYLPSVYFNSIYKYISQNQDDSQEFDKPFLLFTKGRKKQIRVKNYVGVIETIDGMHLEVLPKIHTGRTTNNDELNETKRIFLKMLKHLKDSPFVNISEAHLETKKDFPILEVFIKSYIKEAEEVLFEGIKSDYVLKEGAIPFLKGKIKLNQNIKINHTEKLRFYCEYSEYSPDIPANRLIKATLLKLIRLTTSYSNYYTINRILSHLEELETSANIKDDLLRVKSANRLFSKYKTLLLWSEIFLTNKSFTNFKGENLNIAILFPMEKIFEDYVAFLFSKYSNGYKIKLQDKSYFLIEKHKGEKRFGLRPDILAEKEETRLKIVDTKWKLIDQFSEKNNYNISQADMYQLYAYGRKYSRNGLDPSLVLLYPSNPYFSSKLDSFIYEGDLILEVIPFDLRGNEKEQIENILDSA